MKDEDVAELTKEDDPTLEAFFTQLRTDQTKLELEASLLLTKELMMVLRHCDF